LIGALVNLCECSWIIFGCCWSHFLRYILSPSKDYANTQHNRSSYSSGRSCRLLSCWHYGLHPARKTYTMVVRRGRSIDRANTYERGLGSVTGRKPRLLFDLMTLLTMIYLFVRGCQEGSTESGVGVIDRSISIRKGNNLPLSVV